MTTEITTLDTTPLMSGGDDNILAGIWRKILNDLEVSDTVVYDRINTYAEKVMKDQPEKIQQVRGNLRMDVNKKGMTWFTFTKCLRVLKVESLEITFTFHHLRKTTTHILKVDLDDDFFSPTKEKDNKDPTVLSTFFKEILMTLGVGVREFENLLEQYMRRERLVINLRSKTTIRGYLKKDFTSPKMSWRNFIKALVFLCVLKVDMNIRLNFPRGNSTLHTYEVLLNDLEDYHEELKNDLGI